MPLASPSVAELATFSGRPSNAFNDYAAEALAQATLLFYFATDLDEYPDDVSLKKLAVYGILDMADKIYLSQPYREASASPFQSETIGSYSYSKSLNAVKKGDATGVMWFDMAVNKLKSGETSIGDSGSIQGMEFDGLEINSTGRSRIVGASGSHEPTGGWAWDIDTNPDVVHHHPIF